ncbi:hypothetical protein BGX26_004655 [Mortierella sp. AD094]|nr:hypothetical protein BGX26_004655 [Mortierella sp. AD094]
MPLLPSFSVFAKTGSLPLSSAPSASFSSSSSSHLPSTLARVRSTPFILVLLISISISSICIPLAESAALSSHSSPDSSTSHTSSLLDLPSKVHIFGQDPQEESFSRALADSAAPVKLVNLEDPSIAHLQKRAPATTTVETPTAPKATTTTTKPKTPSTSTNSGAKPTMSTTPTTSTIPTASVSPTMVPDSKGDTALFGKPSVIGSFNLTSGILIYSAFMILFVAAVGSATWKRAKYRNQFREQQQRNMEGGRVIGGDRGSKKGGDSELSDAALFKQASISKRALMKDVGPGGVAAANEAIKTKIAAANGAGRSFEERSNQQFGGQGVRFGESNGNTPANGGTGRTGGMKKNGRDDFDQGAYEMNSYGQMEDSMSDNQDTNDYSRPPLTEFADPYYSSGSSHSSYLDQVNDYHYNTSGASPKVPKAAYQNQGSTSPQSQYSQAAYVQRSDSNRMPQSDTQNGGSRSNSGRRAGASTPTRGLERNGSDASGTQPSRIYTQGLGRSGSGGRSAVTSPVDGTSMSRAGSNGSTARTRVAPSPTLMHPTPISRSNSARLPPSMRGPGAASAPSGLSQQTNNSEYQ